MKNENSLYMIKATIHLKTFAEGGRITGIKSAYRPDHIFEAIEKNKVMQAFIGDIQFDEQGSIQPGETKVVTVRFLKNPMIKKLATLGKKWLIYEGPKFVGEGEIVEIINN